MKKINLRSVNKIPFEKDIREWGNSLFRLTFMSVFALNVKLQIRKEDFCKKSKMRLKEKMLWLFFLLLAEGIFAEIMLRIYGNPDEAEAFFQNSFWLLKKCSIAEILMLTDILASALTEEFYFRYILCNCLKKFRINTAVIIALQAVFFVALHGYGGLDSLNVFVAGIIYGIVLYITRTPVCSWFFHVTHNLMAMSEGTMSHILYGIGFLMCMSYLVICEKVNTNIIVKVMS